MRRITAITLLLLLTTILLLLITTSSSYALVLVPQPQTKGSYCTKEDPNFKELRYKEQIPVCNRNVLTSLKNKIYKAYGVPDSEKNLYTIDHLIPLFVGGSNNEDNLWPQPRVISTAHTEAIVFNLLNSGTLNVSDSTKIILSTKVER